MQEQIKAALLDIERQAEVRIIYACESGSRAWGFPSADSDYDVRFLYVHPTNFYLSIDVEEQRDVIECPLPDKLDVSGWDLRKALKLFRKSNPPLLEWLNSPLVYLDRFGIAARLKDLLPAYFSPTAGWYHYLHMARGNFRDYLHGEIVWVKKYFYVLRPLLALKWIEEGRGVVPMEFEVLVERVVHEQNLKHEIEALLKRKKDGQELDRGPRIPEISGYIERELERLETATIGHEKPKQGTDILNELFRWSLNAAWPNPANSK